MSVVSSLMTMRASVSRGPDSVDSYGLTMARLKDFKPVADAVPMYVWIQNETDYVDGKSVVVERIRAYCRKDAEVERLDVITQVTNRNGDVLYDGPIVIDAVVPKVIGAFVSHLQLELRRHRGT